MLALLRIVAYISAIHLALSQSIFVYSYLYELLSYSTAIVNNQCTSAAVLPMLSYRSLFYTVAVRV